MEALAYSLFHLLHEASPDLKHLHSYLFVFESISTPPLSTWEGLWRLASQNTSCNKSKQKLEKIRWSMEGLAVGLASGRTLQPEGLMANHNWLDSFLLPFPLFLFFLLHILFCFFQTAFLHQRGTMAACWFSFIPLVILNLRENFWPVTQVRKTPGKLV